MLRVGTGVGQFSMKTPGSILRGTQQLAVSRSAGGALGAKLAVWNGSRSEGQSTGPLHREVSELTARFRTSRLPSPIV